MKKILLTAIIVILGFSGVWAQGVTTATISGKVIDENSGGIPGANVVAVHVPSGTQYGTSTRSDGAFTIPNTRVGGPYSITVSFVGYVDNKTENIYLSLGQPFNTTITLSENATELDMVEVTALRGDVFNSDRTGSQTSIGKERVETMPSITRSFNDFTRLTPLADIKGSSISIGGMNNRFNQVTIDGAVSNDVFGLAASGTNGGQTGTSPISLDAIEEFQVVLAPYDVRLGGFAGGGISAITRSGTNEISGSVYHYFRNQNLAGKTPTNDPDLERVRYNDFKERQSGIRIGGPIIKDKLFYFINVEITDATTPLGFEPGTPTSEITAEEAQRVEAALLAYNYNPGSWQKQEETNKSEKIFGRLDWNISNKHSLTLRHSYTKGEAVQLSRGQRVLTFANGAILRESPTHSSVLELNSRFSNSLSNNLLIGYTRLREPRTAPGAPFPNGSINIGTSRTINFGTEAFSSINQLDQDVVTLTDNLTLYKGKHTITFGTHNEFYKIYNAFIGEAYGVYQFSSLENFEAGNASRTSYQYSITDDPRGGAAFSALQLGIYAQDEYLVNDNLKLTVGMRIDVPVYLDSPPANDDFNNSILADQYGVQNDQLPDPAFMFSPRIGFNWDAKGDKSVQVRGGTGVFTSRFPFVWVGGAFTQSGVLLNINQSGTNNGPATIPFNPDPFNQAKSPGVQGPGGRMTVIDQNFKLPQIFRTNIGVDVTLPFGLIGTVEGMYSKNLQSFRFRQINLTEPGETLVAGADRRPLWSNTTADKRILQNYSEVIYIDNISKGYAYSGTVQIQKPYDKGFYGSLAYSFTRSTDVYPGTSSQNHSNWRPLPTVNGINNAPQANSPYNSGSRIVGSISYRKEYLGHLATTISVFYSGQSGVPFSYVYNGDLNREDISGGQNNDLIYIPTDATDPGQIQFLEGYVRDGVAITAAQQAQEFEDFINTQDYLKERRGQYAERNGARAPFTHQFDVKIIQDIFTNIGKKKNTLQLSLDIFNIGNMLNKDWGRQYTWSNSYFDNTFQVLRLQNQGALSGDQPVFSFDPVRDNDPWTISDSPIGGSRWVGQIGIRYIFN